MATAATVRRRNRYLALSLVLIATSCMFILGLDGVAVWFMWRDAPAVAAVLLAAGLYFGVRWWRTPRT